MDDHAGAGSRKRHRLGVCNSIRRDVRHDGSFRQHAAPGATPFEAGLPIAARDLLLARAVSLMAVVWIPSLSGVAGIVAVKGLTGPVSQPLAVAALLT
jgi:hypothetical protein